MCRNANLPCHFLTEFHIGLSLFKVRPNIGKDEVRALGVSKGDPDIPQPIGKQLLHMGVMGAKI